MCQELVIDKSNLPPSPLGVSFASNPLYFQQWGIHYDRDFYRSHGIDAGASIHMDGTHPFRGWGIKIAVIDDGLETNHADLFTAVAATYDVRTRSSDVRPRTNDSVHGMEVVGVIAARNNGVGPVGVAPESRIYFIRLPFERPVYISDLVEAFEKAKSWGVDVVNCSWGSNHVDDAVRQAIADLAYNGRGGKGTVVVFSAGNQDSDIGADESSLPEVFAVGATDSTNHRAWYSNYGAALDFMAPGGVRYGITTLDLSGLGGVSTGVDPDYLGYDDPYAFAGTSAAAPIVTGVVAQMLQANPNLTRQNVYDVLRCSADRIGGVAYDANGFNPYYGYGKVNANRALEMVR